MEFFKATLYQNVTSFDDSWLHLVAFDKLQNLIEALHELALSIQCIVVSPRSVGIVAQVDAAIAGAGRSVVAVALLILEEGGVL